MLEEDLDLFLQEMKDVQPLAESSRADLHSDKKEATPGQLRRQQAAQEETKSDPNYLSTEYVDLVKPHDILEYKKDGVQHGVYKNLRLGKYPLEARLDLHRKTVEQARSEVFQYICDCLDNDARTVIIVHGKGELSQPHQAILKSYVNKWLRETPEVLAFHTAQKFHGGSGATYVLLRKSERKKLENRERHQKR